MIELLLRGGKIEKYYNAQRERERERKRTVGRNSKRNKK
jgi:hypothetical protein